MSEHTPLSWRHLKPETTGGCSQIRAGRVLIAHVYRECDAALLFAAPDLLAACKDMLKILCIYVKPKEDRLAYEVMLQAQDIIAAVEKEE